MSKLGCKYARVHLEIVRELANDRATEVLLPRQNFGSSGGCALEVQCSSAIRDSTGKGSYSRYDESTVDNVRPVNGLLRANMRTLLGD
jgi:hypothetical protein